MIFKLLRVTKTTAKRLPTNFVGDKADLIFANSTPSALSALNATKDIPIVFTSVTDPVAGELVTSLENQAEMWRVRRIPILKPLHKSMKFLAEELGAKTIGTVYNTGEQNSVVQIKNVKAEAKKAGLKVVSVRLDFSGC